MTKFDGPPRDPVSGAYLNQGKRRRHYEPERVNRPNPGMLFECPQCGETLSYPPETYFFCPRIHGHAQG